MMFNLDMKSNSIFKKTFVLICLFAFVFMFFLPTQFAYADVNNQYVITANSATVFAEPDFSSEKLATLSNKTEILIEMNENSPKKYENDGFVFFKIISSFEGFVFSDLVTPKNDVLVAIPNFNAKTNSTCKVFFQENNKFVESKIILQKGTEIFLYQGFESKKDFTAIAFVKDNHVLYGFLQTKNINPNGINPLIITCVCLILAILGIIFAWLFMKSKKTKIKSKKNSHKKNMT